MLKAFLSETTEGLTPHTWWSYEFAGHNKEATLELKALFDGESPFDTPKPVKLIRRMLELFSEPDAIVLDSFAGSGTTAHAALELNWEDDGNRRYILVQQPRERFDQDESANICRDVTAERVRRVIRSNGNGKRQPNGDAPKNGGVPSFTYARLGAPLFGEYRNFADKLPSYEELAKYVFYTETSRKFDPKALKQNTGRIGEHRGAAYYLLYNPDEDQAVPLDTAWLKQVGEKEKCMKLVVYAEALWFHREDIVSWQEKTQKVIRPMLVPFNLK